jgi:nucleoside-diphosphate-sugar epimerase
MKIFVTGGTGFIGKYLVSSLKKEGHIVYVLARNKNEVADMSHTDTIIVVKGNLENPESYRSVFDNNIDIVYHLAAVPGQKWEFKEDDYERVNVTGTKRLLELSRNRIRKFIFCSSINAIKNSTGFHKDSYGKSKLQAEELVKKEDSFETIILRPAIVYGPRDTGGMFLKMCSMIKNGSFFIIGSGKSILPVVYIDDLIDAFMRAKNVSEDKKTYTIVGSDNLSIEKMSSIIALFLGAKMPKIHIPIWIARLAALICATFALLFQKNPLVTNHRIDIVTESNPLSFQKAREELGFIPQTNFKEGIELTIKWYQKNGLL